MASVKQLFALHQAELAPELPQSSARDCFAITKALVDLETGILKKLPTDLEAQIVRALQGYLTKS